jgi:hypothetical protein
MLAFFLTLTLSNCAICLDSQNNENTIIAEKPRLSKAQGPCQHNQYQQIVGFNLGWI